MMARAAAAREVSQLSSWHSVPFIISATTFSLDWRNETLSSHTGHCRKQIAFLWEFVFESTFRIRKLEELFFPSLIADLSLPAATPHPRYDFIIGHKRLADFFSQPPASTLSSQLQGRCQRHRLCNCLVITVEMGRASWTNCSSLTGWTQLVRRI